MKIKHTTPLAAACAMEPLCAVWPYGRPSELEDLALDEFARADRELAFLEFQAWHDRLRGGLDYLTALGEWLGGRFTLH